MVVFHAQAAVVPFVRRLENAAGRDRKGRRTPSILPFRTDRPGEPEPALRREHSRRAQEDQPARGNRRADDDAAITMAASVLFAGAVESESISPLDDGLHDARVTERGAQPADRHFHGMIVGARGESIRQSDPRNDRSGSRRE